MFRQKDDSDPQESKTGGVGDLARLLNEMRRAGETYISLMGETLKKVVAHQLGRPDAGPEEEVLQFIRFGLSDGREMHPLAAREMYCQKVEAEPDSADLRVRYANVLRFLNYREEAIEQCRVALRLEPSNLGGYLNLGRLAWEANDRTEARRMFESMLTIAPKAALPRDIRESYDKAAAEELAELAGPRERSSAPQSLAWLTPRVEAGNRGQGGGWRSRCERSGRSAAMSRLPAEAGRNTRSAMAAKGDALSS